jgi:hypothetical protein
VGLASAKLPPKKPQPQTAGKPASDFTLPPILRPLLEDNIKKKPALKDSSPQKKKRHG